MLYSKRSFLNAFDASIRHSKPVSKQISKKTKKINNKNKQKHIDITPYCMLLCCYTVQMVDKSCRNLYKDGYIVNTDKNLQSDQISKKLSIIPSLICTDLCNLDQEVRRIESLGCKMLHVDIIDGNFSPSMPIGLETIKQVRKITSMDFDVHLMVLNNEFFVNQMIDIGSSRICFHVENERHISQLLTQIKARGVEAGAALSPATPVSVLEYIIEQCDFVLLMGINPGYASFPGEEKVSYIKRKIVDCSKLIRKYQLKTRITIDGRVSFDDLLPYAQAGADIFVGGSSSLFHPQSTFEENWNKANEILSHFAMFDDIE